MNFEDRQMLLQEQIDAMSSSITGLSAMVDALNKHCNALDKRMGIHREDFLRHAHTAELVGDAAVKANAERLEAVRHDS